jgi:hypothetical protein
MKLIKQKEGALVLDLVGTNRLVFNWANNMLEIWHNKEKKFCIDMNNDN